MGHYTLISSCIALMALAACAPAETASEDSDEPVVQDDVVVDGVDAAACPVFESRNWHAWVDAMPGPDSRHTLHVSGEVDMPTPGYAFEWRVGAADRSATPVQRLLLTATPPDGMAAQVITTETVRYQGPAIAKLYKGILIMCGARVLADIPDVSIAE